MAAIIEAQETFQIVANHSLGSIEVHADHLSTRSETLLETIFSYLLNLFFPSTENTLKKKAIEAVLEPQILALYGSAYTLQVEGADNLPEVMVRSLKTLKLAMLQLQLALRTENVTETFRGQYMQTAREIEEAMLKRAPLPPELTYEKATLSYLSGESLMNQRAHGQATDLSLKKGLVHNYKQAVYNPATGHYDHTPVPYDQFQDIFDNPKLSCTLGVRPLRYLLRNPNAPIETKYALLKHSDCKLQNIHWTDALVTHIVEQGSPKIFRRLLPSEVHRVLRHCTPEQKTIVLSNYLGEISDCNFTAEDMTELRSHPEILARFTLQQKVNAFKS